MDQTVATAKSHRRPLLVTSKIGDVPGVLTLLFILFWGGFSLYQANPPAAVSADANANEFSSGRAMKHLQAISKQPHPPGTAEHAFVRDYIVETLKSNGLEPEIQTATVIDRGSSRVVVAGTVQNVIARLPGAQNSKPILIAGHYDTRPQAFGASDDGSGVVTMLESLRALKNGPPLKNDVIFLFTDAEEEGLLGASGFMAEHPWARDVGLVLNFEARGSSGPSIMFETSNSNGRLIEEFAKAAPHPVANSLSYEVYKRLPNATDFTIFRNEGLDGLNFAYIDGLANYHTPLDSLQHIDERSLQHHGSYALALTRHFGNLDLRQTKAANAVYFDLFSSMLVHYPYSWAVPLAILVLILSSAVLVIGLRRKRLTIGGVIFSFLMFLLTTAVAATFAWLLWSVIFKLRYASQSRPQGETYYNNLYLIGFVALTIAIVAALYSLFRRKTSVENLAAGGLLCWTSLMLSVTFYLPGGSYLFTWPLLFSVIGLALNLALKQRNHALATTLLLVCAVPGLALMIPLTYQIFVGMTLNSIALVVGLVMLQLGLLIPHLDIMQRANRWALPIIALLAGAGFIAAGVLSSSFDRQHPKPSNMFYAFNADSGNAVWASMDQRPDEWTSQFLSPSPQNKPLSEFFSPYLSGEQFRQNSAPATQILPPQITVVNDQRNGDMRTLSLRVTSSRQAPLLSLFVDSKSELLSVWVNGKRLDEVNAASLRANKHMWNMRYVAPPAEGVEIAFEYRNPEPLKIRVVDQSFDLPRIPGLTISRPDYIMPSPHPLSDATLVSKSFMF
jgi:peptidase M28-like protein